MEAQRELLNQLIADCDGALETILISREIVEQSQKLDKLINEHMKGVN